MSGVRASLPSPASLRASCPVARSAGRARLAPCGLRLSAVKFCWPVPLATAAGFAWPAWPAAACAASFRPRRPGGIPAHRRPLRPPRPCGGGVLRSCSTTRHALPPAHAAPGGTAATPLEPGAVAHCPDRWSSAHPADSRPAGCTPAVAAEHRRSAGSESRGEPARGRSGQPWAGAGSA